MRFRDSIWLFQSQANDAVGPNYTLDDGLRETIAGTMNVSGDQVA